MHILRNSLVAVPAILASMFVTTPRAAGQDPSAAAAQAAQQAAMQAAQVNQQQIQLTEQNIRLASQQAAMQATESAAVGQPNWPHCCNVSTLPPTFSVKPGKYSQPIQVTIRDNTSGATIYYTTDGWTPTLQSAKYEGPITIDSSMQLQAIAVGPSPFFARSLVAKARLDVNASQSSASPQAAELPSMTPHNGILPKDLAIPLVFSKSVSSKTADVDDKIELKLAQDISDGSAVLIAKGAPAFGIVTEVVKPGPAGAPGNIEFRIISLDAGGLMIPLQGFAAREGDAKLPNAAALIPVAGTFVILRHGKDAEIAVGTPFTAHIASETPLRPQSPADSATPTHAPTDPSPLN